MATNSQSQPPFLEYHYYDGGRQIETITNGGQRPTWAPVGQAGFDDEFTLNRDDLIIELSVYHSGRSQVTWFGYYHYADDLQYGPRNNYAGVGIWLKDKVISDPSLLMRNFREVLKSFELGELGRGKANIQKCLNHLNSDLDDFVVSANSFPSGFNGLEPTRGLAKTEIKQVSKQQPDWELLIVDALLAAQLVPSDKQASKMLIRVSPQVVDDRSGFEQLKKPKFGPAITKQIPLVVKELNDQVAASSKNLDASRERLQTLKENERSLKSDLTKTLAALKNEKERAAELNQALNGSDEHKRHKDIINAISSIKSALIDTTSTQHNLNNELKNAVGRELSKINHLDSKIDRLEQKIGQPQPPPLGQSHRNLTASPAITPRHIGWIKRGCLALLIIAGVFGLYKVATSIGGSDQEESREAGSSVDVSIEEDATDTPEPDFQTLGEQTFECTPSLRQFNSLDGPIFCEDGRVVELKGVELESPEGISATEKLELEARASAGLEEFVGGEALICQYAPASNGITSSFCMTKVTGQDLTCKLIAKGFGKPTRTFGTGENAHQCP